MTGVRSMETRGPMTAGGRRSLLAVGLVASLARLANLGSFSMWLDEILETTIASSSITSLYASLVRDAVHPPLEPTLAWMTLQLGCSEVLRRLLPIGLGVATVVLLAAWATDRFGLRVGVVTGMLAALSPVHVQYSQELRPYSLALFLVVVALGCMDRYLAGGGRRRLIWSWLACLGCLYTLYFSGAVVLVLLAMLWSARGASGGRAERALRSMPTFCALLLAAFSPWMIVVGSRFDRTLEADATNWSWPLVARRLHHLTIGGKEGDPSSVFLFAVGLVVFLGVVRALRDRRAWVVLFGALVGTVGIEMLLYFSDHWTNTRYDLNGWPFLVVLTALGVEQVGAFAGSRRVAGTVVLAGVTAAFCLLQLGGLRRYYEVGRPEWRRTAQAVHSLTKPDGRVWTTNEWTKICLRYYLDEESLEGVELVSLDGDRSRLAAPASDATCTYVVDGGYPRHRDLDSFLRQRRQLLVDPGGLGTRIFGVTEFDPALDCIWNLPAAQLQEGAGGASGLGLAFDAEDRRYFLDGWSHPEAGPEGTSFVWALGAEAFVSVGGLPSAEYRLIMDLWPFLRPDVVRKFQVTLNDTSLGEFELRAGRQTVEVAIPRGAASPRENVLRFLFAYSTPPHLLDPRNGDSRELSVAFERFRLLPREPEAPIIGQGSPETG